MLPSAGLVPYTQPGVCHCPLASCVYFSPLEARRGCVWVSALVITSGTGSMVANSCQLYWLNATW